MAKELITLSAGRAEMKKERPSMAIAIKTLCAFLDSCPSVKAVVHNFEYAYAQAPAIYIDMKVGEEYTWKGKDKDGNPIEKVCVRKPSADLCFRWFVKHQEEYTERMKAITDAKAAKKAADAAKKAEKAEKKAA